MVETERALRQRFDALSNANVIRGRRRELKAELRSGSARVQDLVREPEWFVLTVPVWELLTWAPRIGSAKCNAILRWADVWPLREVGKLTKRQRERILAGMAR